MKIFMVTKPISPFWDEGSKNLAFSLCDHIKEHNFHLMTCKNVKLPQIDNITYHYFYPDNTLDIPKISLFDKIKLFYKIFRQKKIDIYHFIFTPQHASSLAANLFFKLSRKKSIQTISTPLHKSKLKKCLFADRIVVLSEWTKARIQSLGYKNVVKINPGINLDKFSKKKLSSARKKLNISKDEFVILFPTEYNIKRGTRVVLKILRKLILNFPKVKIIFACRIRNRKDLKEKNFLMNIVNNLSLNKNVIFLNRIDYMPELINSSNLVIFPALSPFLKMEIPMVLLESLALEKPIIISDVPPFNEIFQDSAAGIKIDSNNSQALLKNIKRLIKDKKLRNKLGKESKKLVKEKYDIRKTAKEYKKLYEGLI